jgi:hypothetical protein
MTSEMSRRGLLGGLLGSLAAWWAAVSAPPTLPRPAAPGAGVTTRQGLVPDPLGRVTVWVYDATGQCLRRTEGLPTFVNEFRP